MKCFRILFDKYTQHTHTFFVTLVKFYAYYPFFRGMLIFFFSFFDYKCFLVRRVKVIYIRDCYSNVKERQINNKNLENYHKLNKKQRKTTN